jgi:hypothetical protein
VNGSLFERIEKTRSACKHALQQTPLQDAALFLDGHGTIAPVGLELLGAVARTQKAPPELLVLTDAAAHAGVLVSEPGVLERALLIRAALVALEQIADLPVHESVKHLFCEEFASYADVSKGSARYSHAGFPFVAMSKIVLLQRFPGGSVQWEVSGFPRSWFARIPARALPGALSFFIVKARALRPYFVWHMGGTTKKLPFLLERQFFKTFYRMAASLEKQPSIRAIMGASWMHSAETHRISPHLAFLNRPFEESGGIYLDLGHDKATAGFLVGDTRRASLYASGNYKPTFGVVICTRDQAISWKEGHPEYEALSSS